MIRSDTLSVRFRLEFRKKTSVFALLRPTFRSCRAKRRIEATKDRGDSDRFSEDERRRKNGNDDVYLCVRSGKPLHPLESLKNSSATCYVRNVRDVRDVRNVGFRNNRRFPLHLDILHSKPPFLRCVTGCGKGSGIFRESLQGFRPVSATSFDRIQQRF
jgi:hypothetical protein